MSEINIDFQRLLQLVRCSLLGKKVDASMFDSFTGEDWLRLMRYSKQQGVSAIAFHAFDNHDACSIKPGVFELGKWYGLAGYVEKGYQQKHEIATNMARFYTHYGIDMLLMKGLSMAHLYPIPACREFGDLDIYTFENHNKVNELMSKKGLKVMLDSKHDEFTVGTTPVENHNTFLQIDSKAAKILEDYLHTRTSTTLCERSEDGWLVPTADFNAVYLVRHMTTHLAYEGLPLKNILDYALFLLKEGDKVNWSEVHGVLKKSGMATAFDTFVGVCERVLDEDLSQYKIGETNPSLVDKVMKEVIEVALHAEMSLPLPLRFYKKLKRFFSRRWLYSSGLLPDKFWGEFVRRSIRDHLLHPERV